MADDFNHRRTWGPTPAYPLVESIAPLAAKPGLVVVAGPCSIEDVSQVRAICTALKSHNVHFMRGGVFRAGTYPGKVFGLDINLQRAWSQIARESGLKTIVEVLDMRELDVLEPYADCFQVGARQMQNYTLLGVLGNSGKPVFLKRNMGATLDEFLGAAEYVLRGGGDNVTLIERGSSTHMNHVRWDLSISLIAAVKRITGMPILVDASHGTGRRDLVEPMILAGVAAGADGFLVETHPNPCQSLSDADQAYPLDELGTLIMKAHNVRKAIG